MKTPTVRTAFGLAATALIVAVASAVPAKAAEIVAGKNAFVANYNLVWWSIPYSGGSAQMLVRSTFGYNLSHVTYLQTEGLLFGWITEGSSKSYVASSKDGRTWHEIKGTWSGKYKVDRTAIMRTLFAMQGNLFMELSPMKFGAKRILCVSKDGASTWQCNSEIPNDGSSLDTSGTSIVCGDYIVHHAINTRNTPSGLHRADVLYFTTDGLEWVGVPNPGSGSGSVFDTPIYCANGIVWTSKMGSDGKAQLMTIEPKGATTKGTINGKLTGITGDGETLIAYSYGTPYISRDNGRRFRKTKGKLPGAIGQTPQPVYSHGMYVANTGGGLVQSSDGVTWRKVQ